MESKRPRKFRRQAPAGKAERPQGQGPQKLRAITHRSGAGRSSAALLGRGAAHIAGVEVLPDVWDHKAAVGEHTPCRVVGRRVRLAPHQEPLWDRLVCPVPSVDVVLVVPRHLPRVFDVAVATIACDLRAEPPGAVLLVVAGWRLLGILHPGRPPLQHGLAPLMQGDRHPRLFNFHEVGRELSSSGRAGRRTDHVRQHHHTLLLRRRRRRVGTADAVS